ncbi:uncharacterized protein LOC105843505 [Hydra vulgaris]|uniref:uncharacterized protein LOC105843505 n=1 Tax=Hydra vulgaris TaxID=6087 RepID=UPI0006410035|nr:uncharacterized protein LOC105843505 [Hydra vulgaris]XP_047138520.1 uncharacterized protein LOC105843505 [Hydra vulgaris]
MLNSTNTFNNSSLSTNVKTLVTHLSFILIINCPIGIVLHINGLYLLIKNKVRRIHKIDRVIVINLSLAEVLTNAILFIFGILDFAEKNIKKWMLMVMRTFIFAYYITTVILTLNRFLILYLHVRYYAIISKKRAIYCLLVSWICSVIFGYITTYKITNRKVFIASDVFFDTFITLFYLFVYGYAMKLSRNMSKNKSLIQEQKSFSRTLILPALYVTTYVIFTGIPHFIFAPYHLLRKPINKKLKLVLDIFFSLSFWNDAVIYIYTKKFHKFISKHSYNNHHKILSTVDQSTFTANQSMSNINQRNNRIYQSRSTVTMQKQTSNISQTFFGRALSAKKSQNSI